MTEYSNRTRFASPATLECWAAGVSLQQIARRIGRTRPCVSQQFTGLRRLQPEVLEAIRELAGDLVASRVQKAAAAAAAIRERAG